jgi:hypothetical protein
MAKVVLPIPLDVFVDRFKMFIQRIAGPKKIASHSRTVAKTHIIDLLQAQFPPVYRLETARADAIRGKLGNRLFPFLRPLIEVDQIDEIDPFDRLTRRGTGHLTEVILDISKKTSNNPKKKPHQ